MGLFRLFDGARARERYSLLAKDPLRGQNSSICEECRKANFLLKKLTWGNAGRSASERFPSDPRTHISPIIVHRALFFEKKGGGKSVGKRRARGGGASSIRGIAPGSWRDSLRDIDRAISQRDARVAFGEYAWGKETPRSSWILESIGERRRGRLLAWLRL